MLEYSVGGVEIRVMRELETELVKDEASSSCDVARVIAVSSCDFVEQFNTLCGASFSQFAQK